MFENRLEKYLKTIQITQSQGFSDLADKDAKEIIEFNGSGSMSYNQINDPIFDGDFSLFNVASDSSALALKPISHNQNQLKKTTVIKTVQVEYF